MQDRPQNRLKLYNEAANRGALFVRRKYPHLVGILVHGSVAREEPGPFSDIDLVAVTNWKKKPAEFSYFDGDTYVPVGFLSVAELRKEFNDPKAFFWARGSALVSTKILYDPKRVLRSIMLRWKKTKPSRQVLEKSLWDDYHQIIEYSGKLRNGWLRRDEFLTRYAARIIAQHVEMGSCRVECSIDYQRELSLEPGPESKEEAEASENRLPASTWAQWDARHIEGLPIRTKTLRKDPPLDTG